jgi:hypothetical protein
MWTGTQFTGSLAPNATNTWFTFNWPSDWHVVWYAMPTAPYGGGAQVDWSVTIARGDATHTTYWITVRNLTAQTVNFEGRFAVLN